MAAKVAQVAPRAYPESAYLMDVFTAASIGDNDLLKEHITRGADLNARNVSGWTAVHYAAYLGHEPTVALLLAHAAKVDVCNAKGQTPLMLAAACGNVSSVNLLLQKKASVDRTDVKNRQALHYAASCSQNVAVDVLLRAGADPNSTDATGMTPTLEACAAGHELTLVALLEKGGDLSIKNKQGDDGAALACPALLPTIRKRQTAARQPTSLAELLTALQLERLLPKLHEQNIDLRLFFELNEKDFDEMGTAYGPKKKMLKVIEKYKEVGQIVVEQFDGRTATMVQPSDDLQQNALREMMKTLSFVKEGNENIKQYSLEALEKLSNTSNQQLRSLLTNIIDLTEQVAARTARHVHK